MKQLNLSDRAKELRLQNGLSQEVVADESGLSLRTIQRIENNETVPRGDTLNRLAKALNTTSDQLIDSVVLEDLKYKNLMSISVLSFLFFPLLGILIPLLLWRYKKNKIKGVHELGKAILNFEITWSLVLFLYYYFLFSGLYFKYVDYYIDSPYFFTKTLIPVFIMYGYNFIIVILNIFKVSNGKTHKYIPAIKFLK
ncbi:helix-turn-helix domain-containing protein [Cellulophaga sp. F20128]|uniref:helix-turn-helix domain-containing protein n=1 Tax=Cellulophaga sp. F20128 TaxID=2926413 RepID=UPI001FF6967C|nr:helix-turn-helix domain-containing protein [Cellulophaga sp. F20128]MCK0155752.1 helix-turn-helix domain-containing protein [Cellulophaga sp. F20128]